MPENVGADSNCKSCTSRNASSCNTGTNYCRYDADAIHDNAGGEPPYFANEFNQIYYNPDITYDAALTATGLSMGNQSASSAKHDGFGVMYSGNKNLLTNFPDIYYCNTNSPASLSNTSLCRRNGIDNVQSGLNNYFLYNSNNATTGTPLGGYPVATGTTSTSFIFSVLDTGGHPFYYTISPHEYCTDANLINCALANANGSAPSGYSFPAPIRYCGLPANTALTTAVSDAANSTSPKCRKKFDGTNYAYPRYGRFRRIDIVSTTATYPLRSTARRTDCANAAYCTYAEEIQNFANWYS
jgi:type IV pilus assembly protein PilY1